VLLPLPKFIVNWVPEGSGELSSSRMDAGAFLDFVVEDLQDLPDEIRAAIVKAAGEPATHRVDLLRKALERASRLDPHPEVRTSRG